MLWSCLLKLQSTWSQLSYQNACSSLYKLDHLKTAFQRIIKIYKYIYLLKNKKWKNF